MKAFQGNPNQSIWATSSWIQACSSVNEISFLERNCVKPCRPLGVLECTVGDPPGQTWFAMTICRFGEIFENIKPFLLKKSRFLMCDWGPRDAWAGAPGSKAVGTPVVVKREPHRRPFLSVTWHDHMTEPHSLTVKMDLHWRIQCVHLLSVVQISVSFSSFCFSCFCLLENIVVFSHSVSAI